MFTVQRERERRERARLAIASRTHTRMHTRAAIADVTRLAARTRARAPTSGAARAPECARARAKEAEGRAREREGERHDTSLRRAAIAISVTYVRTYIHAIRDPLTRASTCTYIQTHTRVVCVSTCAVNTGLTHRVAIRVGKLVGVLEEGRGASSGSARGRVRRDRRVYQRAFTQEAKIVSIFGDRDTAYRDERPTECP